MADQVIPGSPVRRFTGSVPRDLDKAKGVIYGLAIGDAFGVGLHLLGQLGGALAGPGRDQDLDDPPLPAELIPSGRSAPPG